MLLKKGFKSILVERGAGTEAKFPDDAYEKAGATLVGREEALGSADIVLKVRPPREEGGEIKGMKEGGTVVSFLYPRQNKELVGKLAERKLTALAMDLVPRISRAQVFDALRYAFPLRKHSLLPSD